MTWLEAIDLKEKFVLKEIENRLQKRYGLSEGETNRHKEEIENLLLVKEDLVNVKLINEVIDNYLGVEFNEQEIIKELEKPFTLFGGGGCFIWCY